jgi:lipopolysaccharide export system protein LptA
MSHSYLTTVAILCSLFVHQASQALPSDREQPIHIRSDRAERDDKNAITTYIGNVELDQGTLHIEADKIIITQLDGELAKIQALGKPARLQQLPEENKAIVYAKGEIIDYYAAKELLVLTRQASIEQDGTQVDSEQIEYLMAQEIVKAKGNKDQGEGDGRVHVVLPPNKKKAPTTTDIIQPAEETLSEALENTSGQGDQATPEASDDTLPDTSDESSTNTSADSGNTENSEQP